MLSWGFMGFEPVFKYVLHIKIYAIWCELLLVVTLVALYRVCNKSGETATA